MVLALWAAGLGAAGQFAKVGVMLDQLQGVYPEAGTSVGFLVSVLSFLGCLLGLVAGMIVARVGYRTVLLGCLALGAGLSLYQASLPPFPLMLVSRLLEGMSHLGIVVAAPTFIAQLAAGRMQATAMTLWGTFFGVAFAIVAVGGVPLVAAYGLPALFLAHAGWMAVMGGLLFVWLPKDMMEKDTGHRFDLMSVLKLHGEVFTSPFLAAPAWGWLFYTLTYVSLVSILPGTVPEGDRVFVAAFMPLAGIVGALTLGVFLLRRLPAVVVTLIGFAATLAMALLLVVLPGNAILCVVMFLSTGLIQAGSFASVPQLNADAVHRAHSNGAMAQMGNVGNLLGTPILLSLLAAGGFGAMMGVVALIYVGAIGTHVALGRMRARPK